MNFLAMKNTRAGKHEALTHLSTTLRYWTLGCDGKKDHMENIQVPSEYMRLNFVLEYFHLYYSLRFTEKYHQELEQYHHFRDSVAKFETDFPGLAISSRAVNKLAKVVSTFSFIGLYHSNLLW